MDKWKEGQFTAESVAGKGPVKPLVILPQWKSIEQPPPLRTPVITRSAAGAYQIMTRCKNASGIHWVANGKYPLKGSYPEYWIEIPEFKSK